MPTSHTSTATRTSSRRRTPKTRLGLTLQFAVPRRGLPGSARFRHWARAALIENAAVTIRLVGRDEGLALNAMYRHKRYPTNVLTFVYHEMQPLSGDIVLCLPVIRDEARAQGKPLDAHLAHLIVHGMLHLQGFEHDDDDDAELMEGLEREIVTALGYADPYAVTAS